MDGMSQDGRCVEKSRHGGHLGTLDERHDVSDDDLFVVYCRIGGKKTTVIRILMEYPKESECQIRRYAARENERDTGLCSHVMPLARTT